MGKRNKRANLCLTETLMGVKLTVLLHPPRWHCYGGRTQGATGSVEVAALATKVEFWPRRVKRLWVHGQAY